MSRHEGRPKRVLISMIFVLLVLFQVSIQVGTSSSSSSSSSFILTRKHMALQGRRERKIACKKASEFYGDINSEYYWLHFSARPIANETESDQVPSPAWNVCNLTLHKTSNSVPHPAIYTVNPEGDSSTARIFISGRLVRNPPDYQPGPQSTQVAFPGRVLHIKRPAVEDEGLWICCTNENEEAMEAFDVTVSGVPANRKDSRLLSGDSFYAVLGKKDGDCPGLPKDNRQCYGAVCYCNVECIVPCLNASSTAAADYYFTWTVTDEGLQLKNERLETVAHNLLGDTGEKRRFEATGPHLTIRTSLTRFPSSEYDGWHRFSQGNLTITCHAVHKQRQEYHQSAMLDIQKLRSLEVAQVVRRRRERQCATQPQSPTPASITTVVTSVSNALAEDVSDIPAEDVSDIPAEDVSDIAAESDAPPSTDNIWVIVGVVVVSTIVLVVIVVLCLRHQCFNEQPETGLITGRWSKLRRTNLSLSPTADIKATDRRYSTPPDELERVVGGISPATIASDDLLQGALPHPTSGDAAKRVLVSWCLGENCVTPQQLIPSEDMVHWSVSRSSVSLGSKLGQGSFGQVFRGVLAQGRHSRQDVAIKMPLTERFSCPDYISDMMREIKIMLRISKERYSPFLVNILGFCLDNDGPPVMILEHCSKGSLLDWLRAFRDGGPSAVCTSIDWHQDGTEGNINTTIPSTLQHSRVLHERVGPISSGDDTDAEDAKYYNYRQKESSGNNNTASAFAEGDHLEPSKESSTPGASNSLPNSVMIRFAYQIASGMETLAAENVLHRDLAARNVLITSKNILKVADFGLSRCITTKKGYYRQTQPGQLPLLWMAPETLPPPFNTDVVFNEKTDVWSFGVVLWEIATLGQVPYHGRFDGQLHERLLAGTRLPDPGNSSELGTQMKCCWRISQKERPDFKLLRSYFASKLEKRDNWPYLQISGHASVATEDFDISSYNSSLA